MSRLDAEYDPAEHHDLIKIDTAIDSVLKRIEFGWICACGERSRFFSETRREAQKEYDRHRDEATR